MISRKPVIICQLFPLFDVSFGKYDYMFISIGSYNSRITIWLHERQNFRQYKVLVLYYFVTKMQENVDNSYDINGVLVSTKFIDNK